MRKASPWSPLGQSLCGPPFTLFPPSPYSHVVIFSFCLSVSLHLIKSLSLKRDRLTKSQMQQSKKGKSDNLPGKIIGDLNSHLQRQQEQEAHCSSDIFILSNTMYLPSSSCPRWHQNWCQKHFMMLTCFLTVSSDKSKPLNPYSV